ncbi:MAG: C39 family peptidase [Bacilli bacterium]|nr:C39 family peptidase [Bacilli bacterium]
MAVSDKINNFVNYNSYGMNGSFNNKLSFVGYGTNGGNAATYEYIKSPVNDYINVDVYGMNGSYTSEPAIVEYGMNGGNIAAYRYESDRINNFVNYNSYGMNVSYTSEPTIVEYGINGGNTASYKDNSNKKNRILGLPSYRNKGYGQIENVVGYSQKSGWGNFGYKSMESSGCGPTAIAIALASLTGNEEITPTTIVNYMNTHNSSGESVENISSSMTVYGATCWGDVLPIMDHFANVYKTPEKPLYTKAVYDFGELKSILASGKAAAVTIEQTYRNGYGINLSNGTTMGYDGHYIVLTGVAKDKVMSNANDPDDYDVIIADPANPYNNGLTTGVKEMAACAYNTEEEPGFFVISTEPLD